MIFLYIPPAPLRYPIILEEDDTPDKAITPIIMSYINCKSKLFNYPCLSITRGFYFFFHYKIHIKVINIANMFNRFVFRVAQVSNASSRKSTSSSGIPTTRKLASSRPATYACVGRGAWGMGRGAMSGRGALQTHVHTPPYSTSGLLCEFRANKL